MRCVRYHAPAAAVNDGRVLHLASKTLVRGRPHAGVAHGRPTADGRDLLAFATQLLAAPLAGERLLGPAPVPRFQVEAVLLDVFDDVFLLYLALEPAEGVLDRLALLELDLGQTRNTP